MVGREELHKPILDYRLAVAAGNGNQGNIVLLTMIGGNALEGLYDVVHLPNVGIRIVGLEVGRNHKGADTTTVKVVNIAATGIAFRRDCKEEGALRLHKAAAVGEEMNDIHLGLRQLHNTSMNDGVYLLCFHKLLFSFYFLPVSSGFAPCFLRINSESTPSFVGLQSDMSRSCIG